MKTLLMILIAVFVLTACERQSHSGRLAQQRERQEKVITHPIQVCDTTIKHVEETYDNNLEKVVIIEKDMSGEVIDGTFYYHYKIKRIKYNVTDYGFTANAYDRNDTILIDKKFIR